jgi:S1-C subfamily serine protease
MKHVAAGVLVAILEFLSTAIIVAQDHQPTVSDVVKSSVGAVVLIVVGDDSGKPTTEGSGFIISPDGKIVTNHHVIAGARTGMVKLDSGASFTIDSFVADDAAHDIAILKVSGRNLPSLELADSDRLSAGDHVVAIGSPLGLENSVSDGIISGFREDSKSRGWLQTTAPVSHGSSGGPLLTMDGRVAGVVTWKAGEGENVNFAVPSKLVAALLANPSLEAQQKTESSTPPATLTSKRLFIAHLSSAVTPIVVKNCSAVTITDNREAADYTLRDRTLYNRRGDVAYISPANWLSNVVKDVCEFIQSH